MSDIFRLKGVIAEDFIQYKVPSLFLSTSLCDWKCCHEGGFPISVCQNEKLGNIPFKEFSLEAIYNLYISNEITRAIVIGGLEPMLQFEEVFSLIKFFRNKNCMDDIVIYTGYYKAEIIDKIKELQKFSNIVVKFGRFVPNQEQHFDEVLGINLISSNQYAERIS